jgi:undecaprenyl-diphosphatase
VVWLYPKRFTGLFDFTAKDHGFRGVAAIQKLILVSLPALILGFLFHKTIKAELFGPLPVAAALIVGGFVLVFVERFFPPKAGVPIEEVTPRQCLIIGLFQCLSLWPGMSRSGSTIVGGIVCGLHRTVAAEFSFLAAVPIMCAAVTYDMYKHVGVLSVSDLPIFAVGFLVAFLSALLAIRFMIALLGKFSLKGFGIYRIILGCLVLWILWL